jgi:hypothetical protein
MSNILSMSAEFERQKKIKALAITGGISGALLLIFIFVRWNLPTTTVEEPTLEQYFEVNLGTGDEGLGDDQPLLPGDPAPSQQTAYVPPAPSNANEESVRDIATDDNNNDAPPVIKPTVSKPDATKINSESKTVKTNTSNPQPVVNPTPPKPKAVVGRTIGGNGNGGNGADRYDPGGNQGINGGNGDQGRPGGDPNGRNYTGTPRNMGVRVINIPAQRFEDDFNEGGKIALDVVVDANGKLVSASYSVNGSTLPKASKQYSIALRRAREIPYPKYDGGFKQKLSFSFDVN